MNEVSVVANKVSHPSSSGSLYEQESSRERIEMLISSGSLPSYISNYEKALVIAQMGKDLGFSPTQSFQYIISVQGNLTINAKGIGILLKREGYTFKLKQDAAWVLEDKTYETIVNIQAQNGVLIDTITGKRVIDRITIMEYRKVHTDGYVEQGEVTYLFSDARTAGLTEKDVWKKYPKAMMLNRCKTKMANELGLLHLPETEEIALVHGRDVVLDGDGNVVSAK